MSSVSKPPILLLHGAWHGSWCWELIMNRLAAEGHAVLAIDLPGHGLTAPVPDGYLSQDLAVLATATSPASALDAEGFSAAAIVAVRAMQSAFGPVVVAAHSLAGVALHRVGEAVPELLHRMVYIAATAPTSGRSVFDDVSTPGFADSLVLGLTVSDPAVTGVMRVNWNSADADYRAMVRECFYGGVPDAVADAATRRLTPDVPASLLADTAALSKDRWGSVPRTWIRCNGDRAVPVEAQDASIAGLDAAFPDNPFDRVTLDTGHSPFLSVPDVLAASLIEAAKA